MGSHGIPHPGIFYIYQPVFLAGLTDDLADRRIMDLGYFREEMMFDLEIQSPHQPGNNRVVGCEIGGRPDLVHGPLILQSAGLDIGYGKGGMLNGMRQLEYQAQHKSRHKSKYAETDQPVHEP